MSAEDLYEAQFVRRDWAGTPAGDLLAEWERLGLALEPRSGDHDAPYRPDGLSWADAWERLAVALVDRLGLAGALVAVAAAQRQDGVPWAWPLDATTGVRKWDAACLEVLRFVALAGDAEAARLKVEEGIAYQPVEDDEYGLDDLDAWRAADEALAARVSLLVRAAGWLASGLAWDDALTAAALTAAVTS